MKKTVTAVLLLFSFSAFAKDVFVFTKSFRSKNVLHFDVKTEDCRISESPVSAYWIMGEENGEREALTSDERKHFTAEIVRENGQEIEFTLPAFNQIDHSIVDNPILVKLVKCVPKAFVVIDGEEVQLEEIHANISIIRQKIKYLLIKGKKSNGAAVTQKIEA